MPPAPRLLLSFQEHYDDLLNLLTRRMSDRQRAADVAQETYLRLLNIDASVAVLNDRSFIFRVAGNLAIWQSGNLAIATLRREQRLSGILDDALQQVSPTRAGPCCSIQHGLGPARDAVLLADLRAGVPLRLSGARTHVYVELVDGLLIF